MKSLEIQEQKLNKQLETNTKEIGKLKNENVKSKQALSLAVYNVDTLAQYEQLKNIQINKVAKKKSTAINMEKKLWLTSQLNKAFTLTNMIYKGPTDWVKRNNHLKVG